MISFSKQREVLIFAFDGIGGGMMLISTCYSSSSVRVFPLAVGEVVFIHDVLGRFVGLCHLIRPRRLPAWRPRCSGTVGT